MPSSAENDTQALDRTGSHSAVGTPTSLERMAPATSDPCDQPVDAREAPAAVSRWRTIPRRVIGFVGGTIGWLFGLASLVVGLAILAATPILQFFSLGYLLEAAGRVARSGRLRDAAPGVRLAGRLGAAALGIGLVLAPIIFVDGLLADSILIDPGSPATKNLELTSTILGVATLAHLALALARGARFGYFVRPISNLRWSVRTFRTGGYLTETWAACRDLARSIRAWHHFSLGVRGFVGAFAWLVIPSALLVAGPKYPIIGWLGAFSLVWVLLYLPFLQIRFTAENRFSALFEVRAVRRQFTRAPIAFLITFLFTLALALPLYLLKIEMVPRDVLWLPALLFIMTILPMKILAGWTYARAERSRKVAHWALRWPCRVLLLPIAASYTLLVFLSQYTGWHGAVGIFEHHAFLLPVPF